MLEIRCPLYKIVVICKLSLIFLIFRLLNIINWSWYWIISPIWIPFVSILITLCFVSVFKYENRFK